MARIRTIKPEFARSASTAQLSRDARLLFLLLLPEVDDDGRMLGSAKLLDGLLYPSDDDVTAKKIERWLEECERAGMVTLYEVTGTRYLQITNFAKHQKVSHKRDSVLPPPPRRSAAGAPPETLVPYVEGDMEVEGNRSLPPVGGGRAGYEIWDAFVELLGYEPQTKDERSLWGRRVKELKEVGATPDEIRKRGQAWRRKYPSTALTINVLPKWWGALGAQPLNGAVPQAWDAIKAALEKEDA